MGHRNREKIDFSKFVSKEALRLPGNINEWSCFHNGTHLKVYLSESYFKKPYTIVGVCDGDDIYIRKQFDGHENSEAFELFWKIAGMSVIFRQDLYNLGMIDD